MTRGTPSKYRLPSIGRPSSPVSVPPSVELPEEEELAEGLRNLIQNNWSVDYIISHCCSTSTQEKIADRTYQPDILTRYFEKIKEMCRYRKWFFGHYHDNMNVNSKEVLLYDQIIRIH